MDSFLPSEIGRLIYGYLRKQCGECLADEFLNSCDVMQECRIMKYRYAKKFHATVQDLTLEDILDQYSVLCSLIFRNTNEDESVVHRNVLSLLKNILNARLGVAGGGSGGPTNSFRSVSPCAGVDSSTVTGCQRISASMIEATMPANSCSSNVPGNVTQTVSPLIPETLTNASNLSASLVDSKANENVYANEVHLVGDITNPSLPANNCELNGSTPTSNVLLDGILNSRSSAFKWSNDGFGHNVTDTRDTVTKAPAVPGLEGVSVPLFEAMIPAQCGRSTDLQGAVQRMESEYVIAEQLTNTSNLPSSLVDSSADSKSPEIAALEGIPVPVTETMAPTHISSSTDLQNSASRTASDVSCSAAFGLETLGSTSEAAAADLPGAVGARSPANEIFSDAILDNGEVRDAKSVRTESTTKIEAAIEPTNVEHAVAANLTNSLNLSTSFVDSEANDDSYANEVQLVERIRNPNLSVSSAELCNSRASTSSVADATPKDDIFAMKDSNKYDHKSPKRFANECEYKLDAGLARDSKIFGIARVNIDNVERKVDVCKQNVNSVNSPAKKSLLLKSDSMSLRSKSKENSPAAGKCRANTPKKSSSSSSCLLNETLLQAKNCNVRLNYMTPPKRTAEVAKDREMSVDKTILMSPFSKILVPPLKPLSKLLEEKHPISNVEKDTTRPFLKSPANRFSDGEDKNLFLTPKPRNESYKEDSSSSAVVAENTKKGDSFPWDYKLRQALAQEEAAAAQKLNREPNCKKKKETPKKRKLRDVNDEEYFESKKAKTGENNSEVLSDAVAKDGENGSHVGSTTSKRRRTTKPKTTSEPANETAASQKPDEAKRKRCKKEKKMAAEVPCKNTSSSTIDKIIENVVRNGNSPAVIKSSEANETCSSTNSDTSLDRRKIDEYIESKVTRKIESLFSENEDFVNDDTVLSNAKNTEVNSSILKDASSKPSIGNGTASHVVEQNVSLKEEDGDSCDTFELKFSELIVIYSKYID